MQIVFTDLEGSRIRGSVAGIGQVGMVEVFIVNAHGRNYLVDKATRKEFFQERRRVGNEPTQKKVNG